MNNPARVGLLVFALSTAALAQISITTPSLASARGNSECIQHDFDSKRRKRLLFLGGVWNRNPPSRAKSVQRWVDHRNALDRRLLYLRHTGVRHLRKQRESGFHNRRRYAVDDYYKHSA